MKKKSVTVTIPTWRDVTSYTQSDKVRIPSSWELKLPDLSILVHRYIGCYGWFLSCYDFRMERIDLTADDIDKAKLEAVEIVKNRVRRIVKSLTLPVSES